ncbi:MAG: hypothetical protein M0P61_15425 [Ignavibacteriaceae bacterium]|nr:hypothetical protein [Ignavibacteriaceae bacterium]
MGFPVKTSDTNWLEKTLELFEKRISISIIDDASYKLHETSDIMKMFNRYTLNQRTLMFIGAFYVLSLVCIVLFYQSLFLQYAKPLGVSLSFIGIIVCFGIPTYFLMKNKAPMIEKTDSGIDIKFH